MIVVQLERSGDGGVESSELERGKIVSDSEKITSEVSSL